MASRAWDGSSEGDPVVDVAGDSQRSVLWTTDEEREEVAAACADHSVGSVMRRIGMSGVNSIAIYDDQPGVAVVRR